MKTLILLISLLSVGCADMLALEAQDPNDPAAIEQNNQQLQKETKEMPFFLYNISGKWYNIETGKEFTVTHFSAPNNHRAEKRDDSYQSGKVKFAEAKGMYMYTWANDTLYVTDYNGNVVKLRR